VKILVKFGKELYFGKQSIVSPLFAQATFSSGKIGSTGYDGTHWKGTSSQISAGTL